jgi:tetratricopeptide (TPR) repeat protein
MPLAQEFGDPNQRNYTLAKWGLVKLITGSYAEARVMAQESNSLGVSFDESTGPLNGIFVLGGLALAQGNFKGAIDSFEEAAKEWEPVWYPDMIEQVIGARSIAQCNIGDVKMATEPILKALRAAHERHSYPGLSYVLPAVALIQAFQGRLEQAIELFELICEKTIYGNTPWLEDVVGKRIKQLASSLPHEVVEAAMEGGRKMDLFATSASLLEEFEHQSLRV